MKLSDKRIPPTYKRKQFDKQGEEMKWGRME